MQELTSNVKENDIRTDSWIKKWAGRWSNRKAFAVVLILALTVADYITVQEFFTSMNLDPDQVMVYSLTLAICLEGLPFFLGISASSLSDKSNYKRNHVFTALVGSIVTAIGISMTFTMVIILRGNLIESKGGREAFELGQYAMNTVVDYQPNVNATYLKDLFLQFSPILTSILAFVASWVSFPSENHIQLEREMDDAHLKYIRAESRFQIARNTVDLAKASLWKDLADSDTNMPRETNKFRQECYARIRNQLMKECLSKYPAMIDTYNTRINGRLLALLGKMPDEKYTTVPEEISKLDLKQILDTYDSDKDRKAKPINSWNPQTANDPLMDALKVLLNTAVVTAQFRSTAGPKYMEGNKY